MPEDRNIPLVIEPPFGGINQMVSPRGIHPRYASNARNVWTRYGTIDVRDPWIKFSDASDWADGVGYATLPYNGLGIAKIVRWHLGQYASKNYIFVHILPPATSFYVIVNGLGVQVTKFLRSSAAADRVQAAVQVGQILFIVHLTVQNRKIYYDSGTSALVCEKMGIDKPSGWMLLPVNTGAGGFPGGTRVQYYITYANSKTPYLCESGADGPDVVYFGTDFDVEITVPDSADSQVDKVRIYRRVEGLDDTWFLLGEYAQGGPTVVVDTNGSIDKSFDNQVNLGDQIPPMSRAMAEHKGRLWFAPADAEGYVRHSELHRPENVNPLNDYYVGGANGEFTKGMFSLGAYLFVVRSRSLWAISGSGPESFASERISADVDCASGNSIIVVGNEAAFWSGRAAVYQLDGRGVRNISPAIDPAWLEVDDHYRKKRVTTAWDARHQLLWVCAPWYGVSGTALWAYDPRTENWTYHEPPDNTYGFNYILSYAPDPDSAPIPHARPFGFYWTGANGPTPGTIDILRLYTPTEPGGEWKDLGTDGVSWLWETPEIDLQRDGWKRIQRIAMAWNPNDASGDPMALGIRVDGKGTFEGATGQLNATPAMLAIYPGRLAGTLALRAQGYAIKQTRITRFSIKAEAVGVQP